MAKALRLPEGPADMERVGEYWQGRSLPDNLADVAGGEYWCNTLQDQLPMREVRERLWVGESQHKWLTDMWPVEVEESAADAIVGPARRDTLLDALGLGEDGAGL